MPAQPLTDEQKEDAARLKAIYFSKRKDLGLTQESLAAACGWESQGTVSQYLNGKIPLNIDAAIKFAHHLKVRVDDFSPQISNERRSISVPDDFVRFELHPVRYSAGHGVDACNNNEAVEHLDIARKWAIERLGSCDPDRIKIVICSGTSMSPTIPDGSLLFVDVRVNSFVGDGIYCLSIGHGSSERLLVKRVRQRLKPPCIEVLSDNPTGPGPETYLPHEEDQLTISARVVGWWSMESER
ncbi:LexA family transcriptional regulator [Azonexus sp.]|uniref:LexA family transcriptional regulator n=1 Tax=Azonexus sp. TaxID=1872668 RepID=UPI0039E2B40A